MLSTGGKIIGPAAAIVIVCFFLPWVLVSCGTQSVMTLSGWQMAVGVQQQTLLGSQQVVEPDPILFLTPLAALGCLVVLYLAWIRGTSRGYAIATIVATIAGFLPVVLKYLAVRSRMQEAGGLFTVKTQYGLWGTFLGLGAILIGGLLDLAQSGQQRPPYYSQYSSRRR